MLWHANGDRTLQAHIGIDATSILQQVTLTIDATLRLRLNRRRGYLSQHFALDALLDGFDGHPVQDHA